MIRMIDIAREAGVSRTAVSLILNGRGKELHLSDELIAKVEATARKLGYIRNALANSIVTGRNRTIGLISNFQGFMISAIQGFLDAARSHRYPIQLIPLDYDNINDALRQALEYRVAGICFLATFSDQQLSRLDAQFKNLEIPSIGLSPETKHMPFNQTQSAANGTEYLHRMGHRKIIFLSSDSDIGKERECGYRNIMRKYQLPEIVREISLRQNIADYAAIAALQPDAVQCADDSIALDLLHYCYQNRYYVPECFSVLGFGNTNSCSCCSPHLTSVNEPYYLIGQIRFIQIHQLIEQKTMEIPPLPTGKVIPRESVAPPHRTTESYCS